MKLDFFAFFESIVTSYARLPLAQKLAWPLFIAGTMGSLYFVSHWATQPDYAVLFSDLEESDAGAVVEKLKDMKIAYRLSGDGRVIEVSPPKAVHETRLELATAGLPRAGSVGLELLNDNALGRTVFQEKTLLLRGIQGELERTIQAIEAVRRVRVHITMPEKKVFAKDDILPTASVFLKLKPGQELTPQQLKGISNLVAHSVERMTPENVSIVDSGGRLLNEQKGEDATLGADLTRLEYQKNIERDYAKRVESMLAEILGPGRAIARVNADLDFSRHEREEEAYDPSGQVMRSERAVEESAGGATDGGTTGVVSNLTNQPGLLSPTDSAKGGNLRRESVKNYELSRAVSKTVAATGKLMKMSVAVLVDGIHKSVPTGETGPDGQALTTEQYSPLGPEMLKQIENLTKQAVGFDQARGDSLIVENIRFNEPDANIEQALQEATKYDWIATYLPYAVSTVFILFVLLLVVRPLIRFLTTPTDAEVDLTRLLPAGIEELETELQAERTRTAALPDLSSAAIDIEQLEQLLAENSKLVRDNPQQAALLIRYWINEGRV